MKKAFLTPLFIIHCASFFQFDTSRSNLVTLKEQFDL